MLQWSYHLERGGIDMETRVALLSIIVHDKEKVDELNALLSEYSLSLIHI